MKPSGLSVSLAGFCWVATFSITAQSGVLGPEVIVSDLDNRQFRPDIAFAGGPDEYLVVWQNQWGGSYHDIYAQRLSADGALLSWYSVASLANNCADPSVAYDPIRDRYLVVWAYDVNGDGSNWDIRGRYMPRMGPDPLLTDFSIDADSSNQRSPKVEFALDEDEFMVVWYNEYALPNATDISARRVKADGSGFPAARFWVSTGVDHRTDPEIAYNLTRNEYLVTFSEYVGGASDSYEIYAVRLSGGGTILGSGEFPVATWNGTDLTAPSLASCFGLDGYLVTWEKGNSVEAQFVGGDGVVDGPRILLLDDSAQNWSGEPDVACSLDSASFLVTWTYNFGPSGGTTFVEGRAVLASHVVDVTFMVSSSTAYANVSQSPAVAGGLGGFFVAWEQNRVPPDAFLDIHARSVRPVAFIDGFESGDTSTWSSGVP